MDHSRVRVLTDAPIHFGQVPREHWHQPDWVDEDHAKAGREKMMAQGIIYAGTQNPCLLFAKSSSPPPSVVKAVYRRRHLQSVRRTAR